MYIIISSSSSECSVQGQGPSLQVQEPRLQFCWRQVFHHKLRNQCCSFTRDWIGAVASCCFPHPTLTLASEQTLKDPKRFQGHHVEVKRVDLANWALWTSPKFTTGVKYQFHQGFWPDQGSGNPNHPSLHIYIYIFIYCVSHSGGPWLEFRCRPTWLWFFRGFPQSSR